MDHMNSLLVLFPATPPAVRGILGILASSLVAPWGVRVPGFTVALLRRSLGPSAVRLVLFGHEALISSSLAMIWFICTNPSDLPKFVRG